MKSLYKSKIAYQYPQLDLLKLSNKINGCASNQIVTTIPINAGGRTILVGIDYNPGKANFNSEGVHSNSIYGMACDGVEYVSEGYTVGNNRERLIESTLNIVKQLLESIIPGEEIEDIPKVSIASTAKVDVVSPKHIHEDIF